MKNTLLVIKKELDKIFKFPRMIFSTILLPGFMIFIIYGIMGTTAKSLETEVEEHNSIIYFVNDSENLTSCLQSIGKVQINITESSKIEEIKQMINDKEADALVVLDSDFDTKVQEGNKPNAEIYYSAVDSNSSEAFQKLTISFESFKNSVLTSKNIDIEFFNYTPIKVNSDTQETGKMLSMILPMFLLIMIFSSALGIGSDAIAGEKERGTLSTILMTPIKKEEFLTGKLVSTVIITLLTAASTFLGMVASLPFNKDMFGVGDVGTIAYSFTDYMLLLVTLLVVALLASILLLTASTIAKNVKEATSYGLPIYLIAMICGIMPMFSESKGETLLYAIPIYNCSIIIKDILTMNVDIINFLVMLGSSFVLIFVIIILLRRLIKKESVIFGK